MNKDSKVGDAVTYRGKAITTVAKVEAWGLNTKITYANGFSVVVPGRPS